MAHLSAVTVLVPEYEAGIAFFRDVLGFDLLTDEPLGGAKRWVTLAPPGATECRILLGRATTPEQTAAIGAQGGAAPGARVVFFLETDDFDRDYVRYLAAGVRFLEGPRDEPYGKVVQFADPFGNHWDLIQTCR